MPKRDRAVYMRGYRQLQNVKTAIDQAELQTLRKIVWGPEDVN